MSSKGRKKIKFIKLNKDEVTAIYNERLVNDFVKDEVKPLWVIHKAMDEEIYEPLGVSDKERIIGYVFLVRLGGNYLVDYLATYPDVRNKGCGAEIVELLRKYLSEADMTILEAEDPDYAESEEQRNRSNPG